MNKNVIFLRTKEVIKSDFSIVGFEKLFTQLINIIFFFYVSREISKEGLGVYNWIIAAITISAAILSLGVENIIIRRVATNPIDTKKIGNTFTSYLTLVGLIPILILSVLYLLNISDHLLIYYLLLGAIQALLSYYIMIYRGILLGNEYFSINSKASLINITGKVIIGFLILLIYKNVEALMWGLIFGNLLGLLYYKYGSNLTGILRFNFNKFIFIDIVKESSPLIGVIIFNSALSRFDWLFLGMYSDMTQTGEYTFAYRIYEMSWLPHAIISMVFLPKISKMCKSKDEYKLNSPKIRDGIKVTILVSVMLPTIICLAWTPLIDLFTNGKYGAVNQSTIELLSLTVPFMASIGMLWNLSMGLKMTRSILAITISVTLINIILNIILIKSSGAYGAAIANLITGVIQFVMYYITMYRFDKDFINILFIVLMVTVFASTIYYVAILLPIHWILKIIFVITLYVSAFAFLLRYRVRYFILFKNES